MSFNSRLEEAKDKIYRLPPPGNGQRRLGARNKMEMDQCRLEQTTLEDKATSLTISPDCRSIQNLTIYPVILGDPIWMDSRRKLPEFEYTLRILQWNACILNAEKRAQLEILLSKSKYDLICVSEVGRYRVIHGFPNYFHSDMYRQTAIFWKDGLIVEKTKTEFDMNHKRTLTQCVRINNAVLLIHTYIAPELSIEARAGYWSDMQMFIESESHNDPKLKIILTGDLNTKDIRFGKNHTETHKYLDEILTHVEIASDIKVPTRGENVLDITLANYPAMNSNIKCKVIQKLNSDHNPTNTEIELDQSPYRGEQTSSNTQKDRTFEVIDFQQTYKKIQIAVDQTESGQVTLLDINSILKNTITYKIIKQKPIKFWTPQLKKAIRLQNRARRRIGQARRLQQDISGPYFEFKKAHQEFRKLFKKARKQHSNK